VTKLDRLIASSLSESEVEDEGLHVSHQHGKSGLNKNSQQHETVSGVQRSHSDRPARPCPHCGKFKVRLACQIKVVD